MVEDAPFLEDFTVIGLDFRACPDDLRHHLFVDDREVPAALTALAAGGADAGVVVSTCDRIEVSMTVPSTADATALVASTLAAAGDLPADQVAPYLRRRQGRAAVEHVFRVAAALDSQVVGESQVLGQVKACHGHARAHGLARGLVDQVFQAAFRTAKAVRHETAIGAGATSLGTTAVARCRALHGDLANCAGLMLGGGEAGAILSEDLRRAGLADLCVLDPHPRRARAMARQLGGHHGDFADLGGHLVRGDIVLAALGDGRYALNAEMIEAVLRRRRRRPVMIFDLAVPSDLDPAVNRLEDVFVFTLDDLEDGAAEARAARAAAAVAAAEMVTAAVDRFCGWLDGRRALPEARALQARFQAIRDDILAQDSKVDAARATQLLVNRLLHAPLTNLRDMTGAPAADAATRQALRRLFDLGDDEGGER